MAIGPIDYTVDIQNPLQAAMQGVQFGQELAAIPYRQEAMQMQQEATRLKLEEAKAQAARAKSIDEERARLHGMENKTFGDYERLISLEDPAKIQAIINYHEAGGPAYIKDSLKMSGELISAFASGNQEVAANILAQRAEAARNGGDEQKAKMYEDALKMSEISPKFGMDTAIVSAMQLPGGPEMVKGILALNPKLSGAANVQSSREFEDGTTLITTRDGQRVVRNPAGEVVEGAEAAKVIKAAQDYETGLRGQRSASSATGTLESRIKLGGTAAAAEEAGKKAQDASSKMFEQIPKVETNIANLDKAIAAIDAGADTGPVAAKWPVLKASSVLLESVQSELGLDVIGSVTFGALSEGDKKLALQVALPTKLNENELKEWIKRKTEAQKKLLAALQDGAEYLGTPGNTVAGLLVRNKERKRLADEEAKQAGGLGKSTVVPVEQLTSPGGRQAEPGESSLELVKPKKYGNYFGR